MKMNESDLRAQIQMAGGSFRNCQKCGDEFVVGIAGAYRNDAIYCHNRCAAAYAAQRKRFLRKCQQEGVAT